MAQGQPTTMDKIVFLPDFSLDKRELEVELPKMKEIDAEDRRSVRERLSRESGYTGLSILHRLNS